MHGNYSKSIDSAYLGIVCGRRKTTMVGMRLYHFAFGLTVGLLFVTAYLAWQGQQEAQGARKELEFMRSNSDFKPLQALSQCRLSRICRSLRLPLVS